jgi:hypothetical protein
VPRHASVVSALMRRLAATMGDAYALALGRNAFTRTAEAVTEGCQAPLGILDDLPRMRFARLSENHLASSAFQAACSFQSRKSPEITRAHTPK